MKDQAPGIRYKFPLVTACGAFFLNGFAFLRDTLLTNPRITLHLVCRPAGFQGSIHSPEKRNPALDHRATSRARAEDRRPDRDPDERYPEPVG